MPGRKPPVSLLITAEHASSAIPSRWAALCEADRGVLDTHRGWDRGSLSLARALAGRLSAPLMKGQWSRLLVDLNRSHDHPRRFSEFSKRLDAAERAELTEAIWRPHWAAYADFVRYATGRVVHLACHSFTPILDGKQRSTDIGLLHDPSRHVEDAFCRRLQEAIRAELPELAVHRNRPYKGTSDGLGSWHRKRFDDDRLTTLEIELNQRFASGPDAVRVREAVVRAVERVVAGL